MTLDPSPDGTLAVSTPFQLSSTGARWSVGLAGLVTAGFLALAVAFAVAGSGPADGIAVHFGLALALLAALAVSFSAFTLSAIAKAQHQTWRLLWLPLLVFPAVVAFLVLGEHYWWV